MAGGPANQRKGFPTMSEELTEFHFDLKRSNITYAHAGDQPSASFILLTAPTSRHSRECAFLKQAFFRAVPRDQEPDPDAKFESPSGADMITILAMSRDVDLADVIDVGKKLLVQGVAMVDGSEKLNQTILDRMHQEDVEEMIGEYMVNFTLASTLARMSAE